MNETRPDAAIVDSVFALFSRPEADRSYDEAVTERQHALQTAARAADSGASDQLVGAALLHDIGHLIVNDLHAIDDTLERDAHHEVAGARYVAVRFGPDIAAPVRWHVAAKRYLCATEPEYHDRLSPSSVRSLEVQGGVMSPDEIHQFEAIPSCADAIALRRFDDAAKVDGLEVPHLESYRTLLLGLALPRAPTVRPLLP